MTVDDVDDDDPVVVVVVVALPMSSFAVVVLISSCCSSDDWFGRFAVVAVVGEFVVVGATAVAVSDGSDAGACTSRVRLPSNELIRERKLDGVA